MRLFDFSNNSIDFMHCSVLVLVSTELLITSLSPVKIGSRRDREWIAIETSVSPKF